MKLDRRINSREKRRLRVVYYIGAEALLHTKRLELRYACTHSLLRFINIMRFSGILQGDPEHLETIELTDLGLKAIGE